MRDDETRASDDGTERTRAGATRGNTNTERLREELTALREQGCAMLVVGEVPTEVSRRACATLGGGRDRELVTVHTGGEHACDADDHDDIAHEIRWADGARGATTATAGDLQFAPSEGGATVSTLGELGEATVRAIDAAAEDTGPGELRVCVDSLGPLVEDTDERSVFRFCHQLTGTVRGAGGLGHVHLPMARDSERVTMLGALFDVTVGLELFGGEPRQRWYLHEAGVVSDWLPIGVTGE
jgi:hypothetical protein